MHHPVHLPHETYTDLAWDDWQWHNDIVKARAVERITEAVARAGYDLQQPELVRFGPDEEPGGGPREIAQWRSPSSGMVFSLVPGGRFTTGFDGRAMNSFWQQVESVWFDWTEEELEEQGVHARYVGLFAADAWAPEELQERRRATVEPLLMATHPILENLPQVHTLSEPDRPRYGAPFDGSRARGLHLAPDEWPRVLEPFGWSMPTSSEFEWALAAGERSIFYWADQLPQELFDASYGLDENGEDPQDAAMEALADQFHLRGEFAEMSGEWPSANRFGLTGMVGPAQYCRADESDGAVVVRGGGGLGWPWQNCSEWVWMLSALSVPATRLGDHVHCCMRPVIRLHGEAPRYGAKRSPR